MWIGCRCFLQAVAPRYVVVAAATAATAAAAVVTVFASMLALRSQAQGEGCRSIACANGMAACNGMASAWLPGAWALLL